MTAALKEGFDDFDSMPTYPAFVDLFYARSGFAIVSFSSVAQLRCTLSFRSPRASRW